VLNSCSTELMWESMPLAVGKIAGRSITLGDVSIEIGMMKQGYACLALVALDGKPAAESKSLLLAAAGRVENQGMGWNADRTSVVANWGKGPTVAEFVPATITLPGSRWKAHSLDGAGAPRNEVPVQTGDGKTVVKLSAAAPSLWYLLSQ